MQLSLVVALLACSFVPTAALAPLAGQEADAGCAHAIVDQAVHGACLPASSVPTLGWLHPMSASLNVDAATGRVGIGTVTPLARLDVDGAARAETLTVDDNAQITRALLRTAGGTGIAETFGALGARTNLVSTVSIDADAGAIANTRLGGFLAALTTPASDSSSGHLSIYNQGLVEIAGINGATGIVFGSSKSFVQPHPVDARKEIQYVSLEGPEHGVYVRGTSRLVEGEALLPLPEDFRLVARETGLTVHLTPLGPTSGLYVPSKELDGIVVRENPNGVGDVEFDYLVMGTRSALPEHEAVRDNVHFAPAPGARIEEGDLPGAYRDLMISNGTLLPDGTVAEDVATDLGWRSAEGEWSGGPAEGARPR